MARFAPPPGSAVATRAWRRPASIGGGTGWRRSGRRCGTTGYSSTWTAPPFVEFVAPLARWVAGLDLVRMHHLVTLDFGEVAANWKLLIENFIEPYHVQFVHTSTADQPLSDHYTVNESGCLGCAIDVSRKGERRMSCPGTRVS